MLTVFEYDPKPWEQHRSAVAALRRTIEETGQIRPSSSFRAQRAAFNAPSDVPGFDKIVQLDFDTSTAWVEPNVTMGTLVQATLECGFVPAVVAGSKTISVADAFAATTTESSSFMFGTFDCTVLSMEVILSNGQYVMARSDDKDTADLLWGSAGALHSLGLTTLLEIALIPAGGYVEVMYSPIFSISGARCMMQQIERGPSGPPLSMLDLSTDFVEVIMFDSSSGLAITGRFTPTTGRASVLQSLKGNSFSRHARSVWYDSRLAYKRRVEILPVMEYLFRHDDRHPQARRKDAHGVRKAVPTLGMSQAPRCCKILDYQLKPRKSTSANSMKPKASGQYGCTPSGPQNRLADAASAPVLRSRICFGTFVSPVRALLAMVRWSGGYEMHKDSDTCIAMRPAVRQHRGSSTTIVGTANCDRDGARKASPM
ncbi:24-dehydrocholesterol reductase precursor [Paraphaeosphaeria minitans]|uniref:Delta(24)-sterol reductase n=1 Tax=Paraphaeosphaeria minitans TaxID=565426 RepID=A0A9P6G959_9PLEO|nr:24-dehydrocholesterol reductase precursor [Paraphaeosphaeria minitans]